MVIIGYTGAIIGLVIWSLVAIGGIAWMYHQRKQTELDEELFDEEVDKHVGRIQSGEGNYIK